MSTGHISRFSARDIRPGDVLHHEHHTGAVRSTTHQTLQIALTYDCLTCAPLPGEQHVLLVLPGRSLTATRTPQRREVTAL